ncbi:MAG: trigger factor [Lachnospiraceae bacterium]
MKRKLAAALCMTLAISALATGCGKNEETKDAAKTEVTSTAEEEGVTIQPYQVGDYLKLGNYKGLEVEYILPLEPTKEDIDMMIQDEIEQQAEYTDIKGKGAELGNWVNIDYTGSVDGVEFDGGSAEAYDLELGSQQFIDGFEDQLVGVKTGDEKEVKVTFPNPYENDPTLAGKAAVFQVKVNNVYSKQVPEYNDAFVASVSEKSKTTKEYEQEIKEKLQQDNQTASEESAEENAIMQAVDQAEMNGYPEDLYQACYNDTVSNYKSSAEMFGSDYETFLSDMDMTEDDLKAEAENSVKEILTVQAIAEAENLEPTEEEYQTGLKQLAEENGYDSPQDLENECGAYAVRIELRRRKVGEFLYKNANVQELTQEEYEKKYSYSDNDEVLEEDFSGEEAEAVG